MITCSEFQLCSLFVWNWRLLFLVKFRASLLAYLYPILMFQLAMSRISSTTCSLEGLLPGSCSQKYSVLLSSLLVLVNRLLLLFIQHYGSSITSWLLKALRLVLRHNSSCHSSCLEPSCSIKSILRLHGWSFTDVHNGLYIQSLDTSISICLRLRHVLALRLPTLILKVKLLICASFFTGRSSMFCNVFKSWLGLRFSF